MDNYERLLDIFVEADFDTPLEMTAAIHRLFHNSFVAVKCCHI
jgi:hypothetical protein